MHIVNASGVETEDWLYSYISSGVNTGQLQSVTQEIKSGSSFATWRILNYTYYDGTNSDGSAGDTDLTTLLNTGTDGLITNDAAVLEFDFVPTSSTISFQYVFSSDEYNEFVFDFNDVDRNDFSAVNQHRAFEPVRPERPRDCGNRIRV